MDNQKYAIPIRNEIDDFYLYEPDCLGFEPHKHSQRPSDADTGHWHKNEKR